MLVMGHVTTAVTPPLVTRGSDNRDFWAQRSNRETLISGRLYYKSIAVSKQQVRAQQTAQQLARFTWRERREHSRRAPRRVTRAGCCPRARV